ncbi:MAG: O-antigen ligase family protein [Chloroflexi bacterium]|nr:O-antigen ligase family protein [Chloroflexota bacterium]
MRQAAVVLLALGVGAVGGLAVVSANPLVPFVALIGLLALPLLVTRPMADVVLVVGTITLLPFAVLPVRLALFTPTLLEISLLLLYAAWLLRSLTNPGEGLARTPIDLWLVLFLGCTLFAFVLGLGRDRAGDVIHSYFKLVLSIGIFFAAGNVIRTWRQVALVLRSLIALGAAVASIGIVLWRLPDTLAASLLSRLSVVGYPATGVIRYVNDDPAQGERAIGTQVDPNAFGALLAMVAAFTTVQLLTRKPLFARWLLSGMLLVDIAALVLTQSREALAALLAAAVLIATMRYRRLWAWGVVALVLILALGVGRGYFTRLIVGIQFQDQANQMRLAEYQNALSIVARYPAFGVGFGTAGELDLTTGVSSLYLSIAERTGLIGLLLFGIVVVVFFVNIIPAIALSRSHAPPPGEGGEQEWSVLDSALLGSTAAIFGALVLGVADHFYFYNTSTAFFPHMVALFWLAASLAFASRRHLFSPGSTELD